MARISDILTSSSISMLSFDSRRGCDSSAYKHQSKLPHFFPRFCSFGEPFTLGSISLSLLFFSIHVHYPLHTPSSSFRRDTSFRNLRQWRRGFAGTKTFLRRLKSHSTRSLFFSSALKRKTLRLSFFVRYRIAGVASARVTVRDRVPSFVLHVNLAVYN